MVEIRAMWSSSYDWWVFLTVSKLPQRSSNETYLDHKREQQSFFKRFSHVTDSTLKPTVGFLVFIVVNTWDEYQIRSGQWCAVQRSQALIRGHCPPGRHVIHEGSWQQTAAFVPDLNDLVRLRSGPAASPLTRPLQTPDTT